MNRRSSVLPLAMLVLIAACATPRGPTDSPSEPSSPSDASAPMIQPEAPSVAVSGPLFTEAQAERGRESFRIVCSECHYSSEFRDAQFKFAWKRRTVWDLYREITRTMPDDDPGGLEEQEYVDVVSYILSLNDFPAGTAELVPDEARLDAVPMAAPPGDSQ